MSDELNYLESLQGSGIRPGLERVRALLRAAGHPERAYRSILVAGTNGKGSTSATLASILQEASLRTALYTSPHLVAINERWRVDGTDISEALLEESIAELRRAADRCGFSPTYFEALTVIAYIAFRSARCEVAVMEVGMGGRLDATNVVSPIASAIARIGIDHTEYLGSTIREIAREKAGIIHPRSVAVTSNDSEEALRVLRARARRCRVPLHQSTLDVAAEILPSTSGLDLVLRTPERSYEAQSPLNGSHQVENIVLAVRTAELLQPEFPAILDAIKSGVRKTRWRGRLERFTIRGKEVWVDGAHNRQAAEAIAPFVARRLPGPRALVFGVMRDKEPGEIASVLFPLFDEIIVTEPPDARATPVDDLIAIASSLGKQARAVREPAGAIETALTGGSSSLLITGSLYLAGAATDFLDRIAANTAATISASDNNHEAATKDLRRPNSSVTTC